jgi:hypothetical protein
MSLVQARIDGVGAGFAAKDVPARAKRADLDALEAPMAVVRAPVSSSVQIRGCRIVLAREVVDRLRACLARLEQCPGRRRLDLEWLRLRCEDTLSCAGELQRDSLRQLKKDVATFVEEFPGILPGAIIDDVQRMAP